MRFRILAVLFLAPCLAAALAFGATRTVEDGPVTAANSATSVVWAERVFTNRRDFTAWLNRHGARFDRWARRHPSAARRLQ